MPDQVPPPRRHNDVELENSLSGAGRAVRDAMTRQLSTEEGAKAATELAVSANDDPVLDVLDIVVNGIKTGTDITGSQEQISKLILNQEQRAELINNILMTHDYDRLVKYAKARKVLEDFMLLCAQRGDLSVTEALAFMKIVQDESKVLQNRVGAGASSVKDVLGLLNKIDYSVQENEKNLVKKFNETSNQGREVIRRVAYKLKKLADGNASKSTIND